MLIFTPMARLRLILIGVVLSALTGIAHATHLRVGVYANAPKIFRDHDGTATGIEIEMLRNIARAERWSLSFVPCEWASCLEALRKGEIDLMPDVAYSEERAAVFDFHRTPALHSWSQLYRHRDTAITSLPDLKNKRIALLNGAIQQAFFAGVSINLDLDLVFIPVASLDEAFSLVSKKQADAAIANNYFGDANASRHDLIATPIMVQPASLFFAATKGRHKETLNTINSYLAAWQANPNSEYFAILKRWRIQPNETRIPTSVWWGLSVVSGLLLSVLLIAMWLRRQVAIKTRALRDSEHKLSSILDSVESLIYIKDKNYRYQYVNGAMCRLLGKPPEAIIGSRDDELFDQATAASLHDKDRRVIEQGERVVAEEASLGRTANAPIYLSTKIPLCRGDGTVYALCGISTDITDRKRAEESLRLAATVFQAQEGMFIAAPDRSILNANNAFLLMTGYSSDELLGKEIPPIFLGNDRIDHRQDLWEDVIRTGKWQGEAWTYRKSGEAFPIWLTLTAVTASDGSTTHYVGTQTDITRQKQAQEEIVRLAYYDSLTGLPNRRLLLDRLQHYLTSRSRTIKTGALLFIDLDNFKDLNDTRGHEVGDKLLKEVAQRILRCSRGGDTVARLGGDEFVLLLEDIGHSEAEAVSRTAVTGSKILDLIAQPYLIDGVSHHATCSIGAAICTDTASDAHELMKQGDMAMYEAKKSGRNALCFFHGQMQAAIHSRTAMEKELREALNMKQFRLDYQAQVDRNGHVTGAEALLRWDHPERGLISPELFIPIAEASGLILPVGSWVVHTACARLAEWQKSPVMKTLTIAVNVSAYQFRQPDFVSQVLTVLDRTQAPPEKLKLEITETMLIENVEETIAKMRALKERGVGFALDDFGTGYSSLLYLKRLPLDQLKIDRSFVRDVLSNQNDAAIARSIVALAKELGLGIIAEGVETEAQREFLAAIGCDAYQGYLIGRPGDETRLRRLIEAHTESVDIGTVSRHR